MSKNYGTTSRDAYAVGFAFGIVGDSQEELRGELSQIFDLEEMKAGFADGVWSRKVQQVSFAPPRVRMHRPHEGEKS